MLDPLLSKVMYIQMKSIMCNSLPNIRKNPFHLIIKNRHAKLELMGKGEQVSILRNLSKAGVSV
jgi:hypothetical protein